MYVQKKTYKKEKKKKKKKFKKKKVDVEALPANSVTNDIAERSDSIIEIP